MSAMFNWNLEPLSPSIGMGNFMEDEALLDDAWQVLGGRDTKPGFSSPLSPPIGLYGKNDIRKNVSPGKKSLSLDEEDENIMASFFDLYPDGVNEFDHVEAKTNNDRQPGAWGGNYRDNYYSPQKLVYEKPNRNQQALPMAQLAATSSSSSIQTSPWPSAPEYVDMFKTFLDNPRSFESYSTAELGTCKVTGTPLQPAWIYTNPKPGIYFLQCEHLRGKGSFGFPKCEGISKKTFEWKKTSYVNNVPKVQPIISYITANGNGKLDSGETQAFRMRIIKAIQIDGPHAEAAQQWVLVDIHLSDGLARRMGPRTSSFKKIDLEEDEADESVAISHNSHVVHQQKKESPTRRKNIFIETKEDEMEPVAPSNRFLDKVRAAEPSYRGPNLPISPLKRLSLAHQGFEHETGSPKGAKMQRVFN